jgi:Flp pilus assembly protein TadB
VTGLALLAGIGTGLGLWLIIVGLYPRPVRLDLALDGPPDLPADPAAGPVGWAGRWGRPAVRWLLRAGLPTPGTRRDLATLDKPVDAFLAEQATAAVVGLLLPPLAATALGAAGLSVGLLIPGGAAVVFAVVGFLAPQLGVRSDAATYRREFVDVLSVFLDQVVIGLASGCGVDQALDEAAAIGDGRAFAELRYALAEARLARIPPWETLAALGTRVAVPDLTQLAAAMALAGTEGAKVRASLRSRAVALRERQLTLAEGEANAATERLSIPMVGLFAGFLIFLGYPALSAVLTGL